MTAMADVIPLAARRADRERRRLFLRACDEENARRIADERENRHPQVTVLPPRLRLVAR
jgi:hypothetical protein